MSRKLTIVHVITRLLRGGSEENTLFTCEAQAASGHRVIVMHGAEFEPEMVEQARRFCEVRAVPSMVHPISPRDDVRAVRDLAREIRFVGADVVHTHQSKAGIVGRLAARIAGVRLIVHGVHIIPWANVGRLTSAVYVLVERICARFTDIFISVSPSVRNNCLENGIGQPGQHFVALSPIEIERFRSAKPPPDERELLGLSPGQARPPTAVMLAAFEPRKRQADVLRHLPAAFADIPDWRVVFAGEGPQRGEIAQLARELGIEKNVRVVEHRSDPERLIAMADVCFLCSEREGLPRVLIQYAAGGKPIVVTDLPSLSDVLTQPGAAIVTPLDNVAAAVEQVADLLRRADRRQRMTQEVKKLAIDQWTPRRVVEAVEAAYQAGWKRRSVTKVRFRPPVVWANMEFARLP
jgi:glycosyltransferase involved in cell wall biosynthesis